jgi:hypothetical protein
MERLGLSLEDDHVEANVVGLGTEEPSEAAWLNFDVYVVDLLELPTFLGPFIDERFELIADIDRGLTTLDLANERHDSVSHELPP